MLGHPKSGTNWLCSVLSDYFAHPVFQAWKRLTPAVSPQIFHMHRFMLTAPAKKRTFYLYRDGRDIVVSAFFAMARDPWESETKRSFERFLGTRMDESRIEEQLPRFIEWRFEIDKSSSIRWPDHISKGFVYPYTRLSFEAMKADAFLEVKRAIHDMTGSGVDEELLRRSVERNDFQRKKKLIGNSHFLRSGKAGDWADCFTPEAAAKFQFYAQNALETLGYEQDGSWTENCKSA